MFTGTLSLDHADGTWSTMLSFRETAGHFTPKEADLRADRARLVFDVSGARFELDLRIDGDELHGTAEWTDAAGKVVIPWSPVTGRRASSGVPRSSPTWSEPPARRAGWFLYSPEPAGYAAAFDSITRRSGARSGYVRANGEADAFATFMQMASAEEFRGKRVRLSGWIQTKDVTGAAGLWMRMDTPRGMNGFDNMTDRPLRGSTAWTEVAVVLDAPLDAYNVGFGLILTGPEGTAWVDDLRFDIVGPEVATTDMTGGATDPAATHGRWPVGAPLNLSFDE